MTLLKTLILFCIILAIAWPATGQVVLQAPGASFPTIQAAINTAQSGDTVEVLPGTYFENLVIADKDIVLKAQVRGTVVIDGGGLSTTLIVERSSGCVIDGLHLTNGIGGLLPLTGSTSTYGGGIWLHGRDPVTFFSVATALLVRHCRIEGNQATYGAGIFGDVFGLLTIEDCVVANNTGSQTAGIQATQTPLVVRRSVITDNGPGQGGTAISNGKSILTDTIIRNSPYGAISTGSSLVTRCTLEGNGGILGSSLSSNATLSHEFYDCLMTGNGTQGALYPSLRFNRSALIKNCTIVGNNHDPAHPMIQAIDFAQVTVDNCIIRDNGCADFGTVPPPSNHPLIPVLPPAAITASHCCLSQQDLSGPGNIDLDPLFVDSILGDFRLRPGSPCVDAGDTALRSNPTVDLAGAPRVAVGAIDMGCYEGVSMAHHPAAAGHVGEASGGPYDTLLINGSSGGDFRRVAVPIGSASSVTMLDPPTSTSNRGFVIFGVLAEASVESVVTLPFGIGDMMFAPAPLVPPFLHWLFFVYTDNFNATIPQFLLSTPTPWSSGLGPAIPFPLKLTLQGVLEESPGVYVPTNAIILDVR